MTREDNERLYTAANSILERSMVVREIDNGMAPLIPDAITYGMCAAIISSRLSPEEHDEVTRMKRPLAERIKTLSEGRSPDATMVELTDVHLAARCVGHLGKKPAPDRYVAAAFQGMYEGLRDTLPEEVGRAVQEHVKQFEKRCNADTETLMEAAEEMREKLTASIQSQTIALGVMSAVLARRGVSHESEQYVKAAEANAHPCHLGQRVLADSIDVNIAEIEDTLNDISRLLLHYSPLLDDSQREYRAITSMYRRVLATHFDDKGARRIEEELKTLIPKMIEFAPAEEPKKKEESWHSPTPATWKN